MFKRIDRSSSLARLIEWISEFLARRRGLPVVIGIVLVVVSFVIQVINVSANSQVLQLAGVVIEHIGVLIALIGMLLSQPLGK
ncbi:MAG: hypothetical protein H6671_02700 [Anaerolineaceae bacterium]|nr:hypothetical protein [Anaerolineaceae bacterium]